MTDEEYFTLIATFCYPEFAPTQKTCSLVSPVVINDSRCDACIYNDSFATSCTLDPKYTNSSYNHAFLLKVIEHNPEHLI